MKVFRVIYFAKGLQRVSIVVAKSKKQAEKLVSKDFNRKESLRIKSYPGM
jgi:hypothetical protein